MSLGLYDTPATDQGGQDRSQKPRQRGYTTDRLEGERFLLVMAVGSTDIQAALDERSLVGCRPLVRTVRTGAIGRPFPSEQQGALFVIKLYFEELVFFVWQFDPQCGASMCGGDILLHAHHPAPGLPTAPLLGGIEHPGDGLILSDHCGPRDLEDELGGAVYHGRGPYAGVVAPRPHAEGRLVARGVGVVPVEAFPATRVLVEGEVSREEEHGRPHLAALAHPTPIRGERQGWGRRQHGRVQLRGAVHQGTHRARVHVVLWKNGQKRMCMCKTGPSSKHIHNPDYMKNSNTLAQITYSHFTPSV